MGVNKEGGGYTFLFAAIMVIVTGASLAMVSLTLKPDIKKNEADKKMIDILGSINVTEATRENAAKLFTEYVKERIVLDDQGNVVSSMEGAVDPQNPADPFNVDVQKEYKQKISKLVQAYKNDRSTLLAKVDEQNVNYPLFRCERDGKQYFVIPMVGTGLWGPIWGYVALESDMSTVYGASFDHKTETPGLGAEIKEPMFEDQFQGESIYDNGTYVSIDVKKGGSPADDKHAVDAITGGTITSNGVDEMLYRTLAIYDNYFKKVRNNE
jgi:Na+-transporting NADH:ubiquinone oxidoreductase subunit C